MIARIKFPPHKIKTIVSSQLSQALNNRRVEITSVSLNPFKGFAANEIIIYEPTALDSTAKDNKKFITIDKIYLNYKITSLLRRTIKINAIVIDRPVVRFTVNKQNQTNIDDLLALSAVAEETTVEPLPDTTAVVSLPVAFKLDRFDFKDFTALISTESESTLIKTEIGGLSVFLKDLVFPRGHWEQIKDNISAHLRIVSPNSVWKFYVESLSFSNPLTIEVQFDSNIDFQAAGITNLQLKGNIGFGEMLFKELERVTRVPAIKLLNLVVQFKIDGQQGTIDIQQLLAHFADEKVASIRGSITNILSEPQFDLVIDQSHIRLSRINDVLKSLTPSDFEKDIRDVQLEGELSFKNTRFHGNALSTKADEGLVFEIITTLNNFRARYLNPSLNISGLTASLTATGFYNATGIHNASSNIHLALQEVTTVLSDTIPIVINDISSDIAAEFSDDFFPENVKLNFQIGNCFDAEIHFDFIFQAMNRWHRYIANGLLDIQKLNIANLPQAPGEGTVKICRLKMNSNSLDQIATHLSLVIDSLYISYDPDPLVVFPIALDGRMDIAVDKNFQDISIKNINVDLNDFLYLHGKAEIKQMGEAGVWAGVDTLLIRHQKLFDFLPGLFKEGLENLKIDGATFATAEVQGKIPVVGDPEFNITSKANMVSAIDYPEIPLTIGSITGAILLSSDGNQARANARFIIDDLALAGLRDQPLNNISLQTNVHLPHLDQVILDSSQLWIPDLKSKLTVLGKIDSLSTLPQIDLDASFSFVSTDSVLLINDLFLQGELTSKVHVQLQEPVVGLMGNMNLKKLHAIYADQMIVHDISGTIPFAQKFDFDKLVLINDGPNRSILADTRIINYDLLRPYFWNIADELSYLEIGTIDVMGYQILNLFMDLRLGNGGVEIPTITFNLYDGNMRGNLILDAGSGDIEKARYYLKANISRLNSAKLSPRKIGSKKAAELNLNMELKGQGLDPTKQMDFDGYFYITKIGSKFMDNVLNALDPKGTDKSIQDTKRLLNWGYKPKLISFEIKHGHLYPTIHLVKGSLLTKLIPLNLSGGKIELARIPVKFFLQTQMNQTR